MEDGTQSAAGLGRKPSTAVANCLLSTRLSPEARLRCGCWQVFWLVSTHAPSRSPSGFLRSFLSETYSSGDCPGFAPGSLLIPAQRREPKTGGEGRQIFKLALMPPALAGCAVARATRCTRANRPRESGGAANGNERLWLCLGPLRVLVGQGGAAFRH